MAGVRFCRGADNFGGVNCGLCLGAECRMLRASEHGCIFKTVADPGAWE